MTDKANRVCRLNNGTIYAGQHMAVIKDGKVVHSTADLKGASLEEWAALFKGVGADMAALDHLEENSLCTGYRDHPYTSGNALVLGAETATGDRTTVIGRRVIKDLIPSVVMGGMPSDGAMDPNWGNRSFVVGDMGHHTGHYRFPEPSVIGYWRMLSSPSMQSPLLGRLRLTWRLAMRKAKRRLSLSYGSTRPF